MSLLPLTQYQIPDHAILDQFHKQTYLGNTFLFSLPPSETVGESETPLFYLLNPEGIGSPAANNQKSIFFNLLKLTCLSTDNLYLNLYFNPTEVTGDTSTPINARTGSPFTSISTLISGPTVSGSNGTYVTSLLSGAFVQNSVCDLFILDPGKSLLVTGTGSASSTPFTAEFSWYEL